MMRDLDISTLTKVRAIVAGRHDEILNSIRRLVEIESPSCDVQGSKGVVALLESIASTIPSITKIDKINSPDRGEHLLISAFATSGNNHRATLILGHTDTVHPRGTLNAGYGLRAEGDRLYGPGIFDMKASCVMALEALRCLTEMDLLPERPVKLLLTCDEEIGSATGRPLVEHEARVAAQVLVLEPPAPGGRVKTARKGVGVWIVTAQGVASHAGLNPEAGASAILELARQTQRLHSLSDPASGTSFNVGVVR